MRRFRGKTAIVVSTPLKVSDRSLVEEKEAVGEMEVWTPILLAVVPVMTSSPYKLIRCTGSVGPLQYQENEFKLMIVISNISAMT